MNFSIFFYVILININSLIQGLLDENEKSLYPLPLLYYPEETIYTVTSIESLPQKMAKLAENQSVFSYILFLCDQTSTSSYRYIAQQMLKSSRPDLMEKIEPCKTTQQRNLNTFSFPLLTPGHFSLAIGYEVIAKDISNRTGLPVKQLLIKSDPDRYGAVIFYYSSAIPGYLHYSTMHHFHSYNRSLISSNSCNEYKFEVVYDDEFEKEKDNEFKDIEKYFTPEHQDKLFNGFVIPFSSNKAADTTQLNESQIDKDYFVPHRMVPMNDFIEDNERMATCITFNIVPIYKSISEGPLKEVEEYIQRVAEKLYDHTLTIYTLTSQQLEWKTSKVFTPDGPGEYHVNWNPTKYVFLNFKNDKIPVPKYLLKIVAYHMPRTIMDDVENRPQYYMVIVIHNQVFEKFSRLCNTQKEPICRNNGWDIAPNEDDDGAIVYCCHFVDKGLQNRLAPFAFKGKDLNLDKLITYINVHQLLMKETKKITLQDNSDGESSFD